MGERGEVWVGARGDGGLAPHDEEGDHSQAAGDAPRHPGLRRAPEAAAPLSWLCIQLLATSGTVDFLHHASPACTVPLTLDTTELAVSELQQAESLDLTAHTKLLPSR